MVVCQPLYSQPSIYLKVDLIAQRGIRLQSDQPKISGSEKHDSFSLLFSLAIYLSLSQSDCPLVVGPAEDHQWGVRSVRRRDGKTGDDPPSLLARPRSTTLLLFSLAISFSPSPSDHPLILDVGLAEDHRRGVRSAFQRWQLAMIASSSCCSFPMVDRSEIFHLRMGFEFLRSLCFPAMVVAIWVLQQRRVSVISMFSAHRSGYAGAPTATATVGTNG
ncbi:hypothetical protein L1049_008585 [Liquidambar formosana]|uniref:Uncharacterized protein n=1 Tax=Liquidambar formosana TaxID=63359 RepID=A0AAP0SA20_LIQFO